MQAQSGPQNYRISVSGSTQAPNLLITAGQESYALEDLLGKGSYGKVYGIKKRASSEISSPIDCTFSTANHIKNSDEYYAIKLPFDRYQEKIRRLPALQPLQRLDLTGNQQLAAIGEESLRQMDEEEALKKYIDESNEIETFIKCNEQIRDKLLENIKREASYVTRYYKGSGEGAIILEGKPYTVVTFNCQQHYASLNYQPAIAMLMPKASGLSLNHYPKMYFNANVTFSYLLKLFTTISNAFSRLHALNILHLDASTANIIIDPDKDNQITLIDFGFATNLMTALGESNTVLQIRTDKKPLFWKAQRVCPSKAIASEVVVREEDDVLSLIMVLRCLTHEYQQLSPEQPLVNCFVDCIRHTAALLNTPKTSLLNASLFVNTLLSLFTQLEAFNILDITSVSYEEKTQAAVHFQNTSSSVDEISATLGPKCGLAQKAQSIFTKVEPWIGSFKLSPNAVAHNTPPVTSLPSVKNTNSLFPHMFREIACNLPEPKREFGGAFKRPLTKIPN